MSNFMRLIGVALVSAGVSVAAQAPAAGPCALLTTSDVQPLAPLHTTVTDGTPVSFNAAGFSSCRYAWGAGADRVKVDVTVDDPSKMFLGASPDQIKQALQSRVAAGTADAVIPDVGDAAVFKVDSPVYSHATAYVKGRLLQVHFDGTDADARKDQIVTLLKSAASRM